MLTTTFDLGHDEMVLVARHRAVVDVRAPPGAVHGVAHVGYIPARDGRITGLSKLARLVDVYAKRPQVQERLTTQIADALVDDPRAARRDRRDRGRAPVHDDARRPQARRAHRSPRAVRGQLHNAATRAEAMSLIARRR